MNAGRRFARFAAAAAAVAALIAAVGWVVAPRWGGAGAAAAALVACAACFAGSLAGGLVLVTGRSDPQSAAIRVLAAMGARLVVVVGAVAAAALGGALPLRPLLLWTALCYVALLALDTRFALTAAQAPADDDDREDEDRGATEER